MKNILQKLMMHQTLSKMEAKQVLTEISEGKYNNSQVVAFMTAYMMRLITVEELSGFREALKELCISIDMSEFDAIDLCGTGGDGKNTFNISTLSSLVVAGTGQKVVKHGNYAVSSGCGSSNVMEHLGYTFTSDTNLLKKQVDSAGICFLHAPLFHPAMKFVGPLRRELGMKTFFNMLGPLINPASPQHQITGVFSFELGRLYNYIFQETDVNYMIIHSLDGYDEVSLTANFKAASAFSDNLYSPEELGFSRLTDDMLHGGNSIADSAKIFVDILEGRGTMAQNNVVIANAGMALKCVSPQKSLENCFEEAKSSLLGGKAFKVLQTIIK